VAVVEVQPAGAEDPGGEVELRLPVADGGAAEKPPGPAVHLARHLLGDLCEQGVAMDG